MEQWLNRVHFGDCLETLRRMPDGIVNTCVTSPPYFGLRDYGHPGQIGLEPTPGEFIAKLVAVFREVRRVLRDDGTLWLNIGDSYNAHPGQRKTTDAAGEKQQSVRGAQAAPSRSVNGLKGKDLIGIPWMLAFALRADGWYLRQDIVWAKPNPMPESVTDRCTKAHEYIFLLSKSPRYYFDQQAIKEAAIGGMAGNVRPAKGAQAYKDGSTEHRTKAGLHAWAERQRESVKKGGFGGKTADADQPAFRAVTEDRNKRSVWTVATKPYSGAHFATFPPELIEPCILAGAPPGGVVLDPFFGSGTSGEVAQRLGRAWIGCELNPDYKPLQDERLRQPGLVLEEAA